MTEYIQHIRSQLLAAPDSVCLQRARLITESWQTTEGESHVMRRAKAFAHVLANMDLDLASNPFFAGNTSSRPRAWMLIELHFGDQSQIVVEKPHLANFLDGRIPADLLEYWKDQPFAGAGREGHLAVDSRRVIREGLDAIIAKAEACLDHGSAENRLYRQAMIHSLNAVIAWAHRYADAAAAAARETADPIIREAHLRVARACRHVPAKPARTIFEALQAIVLCHLATVLEGHSVSVSIGLPDRAMAHLLDDGFDRRETTALLTAFMLKLSANSVHGSATKTQAITVGGVDHRRRDQCNALTRCFLDAADLARVGDPHVFLRWHDAMPEDIKERAVQLLAAGLSMPLLVHDEPTARGFEAAGVTPEDAWEYCIIGCNELGIPGRAQQTAMSRHGLVQYLALLNDTLLAHPRPASVAGMDALLQAVERTMRQRLRGAREHGEKHRHAVAAKTPTPFTSALMQGCVEKGLDLSLGMTYMNPGLYERGLTNAANALAAIDELVFRTRSLSLTQLIDAMRSDFADDVVRERVLAAPKWGNNDDRVDRWARVLVELRETVLDDIDREFHHPPHMVCHVVRSLHHTDGHRIAASPDGRHAGTPVCDSIGAQTGTAANGPTGILGSVLKLDAVRYYRGGYNLNITLPKAETSCASVRGLVDGFFDQGGQELQINCVDADTLRAAQHDPDAYGDLVVRFAGLSSRFVDLSPVEQNEIIARAEAD